MGLLDRLFRRGDRTSPADSASTTSAESYKYEGPKLSEKPLTPREIEEMHAKLFPEQHKPYEPPSPEPLNTGLPFTEPVEEGFSKAWDDRNYEQTQSQSLLFSRLPRGVRLQIWRSAMDSRKLYLTAKRGRLAQSEKMNDFAWWPKTGLLNVPMLCRAAYIDSIACLYSCNTFCFGFGNTKLPLTSLNTMLPKQHIDSIEHIEVGWHLIRGVSQYYDSHPQAWDFTLTVCAPDSDKVWDEVCAQLIKLPHLKSLTIIVWTSGDARAQLAEAEANMLTPLARMKHVKPFKIFLPWPQKDGTVWGDAPFRIYRKYKNRERYGVSTPLIEDAP
ncbi:hypothetical protein FALBO_16557 [Fusarium albosuccineum]|uniref:DUF7730 domain-containing protein n=1 Tax=Fusarium albosuccineum TaxID=1237068 RepID=A0A8H4KGZ4_9HYPO|nr:hypothetical protein FALBO_16557 [Fusarium albosuccineum]